MKALKYIVVLVTFTFVLAACGVATGGDNESEIDANSKSIELIAANYKEESEMQGQALNKFVEEVEKLSDGKIKVEVHHNAELGDADEETEKMLNGSIDIGEIGSSGLDQYGMNATPIPELPYLYDSYEDFSEILNNDDVKQLLSKNIEKEGLKLLAFRMAPASHVLSTDPLETIDDFEGLKLRSPEFKITEEFLKAWGARPTVIPLSDVYNALQNGVVKGYTATPSTALSNKTFENAKYLNMTTHMYTPEYIVMNKESFDKLNVDEQDIIFEAAKTSEEEYNDKAYEEYEKNLEKLEENGVELVEYDDLTPFKEAVEDMKEELAESMGPEAVELYETIEGLN